MSTDNLTHHQMSRDAAALVGTAAGLGFAAGFAVGTARARARVRRLRALLASARHAARRDPLTGLPNRTVVYELLDHARPGLVGLVDLDGFKQVNDRFGHGVGDQLLCVVADRLAVAMSGRGAAARLGGDEFVLLWRRAQLDPLAAATFVLDQATTPVTIDGHILTPRASLGVAAAGPRLAGPDLLAAADVAMYQAKPGPDRVRLYQGHTPPEPVDRPTRRRRDQHQPHPGGGGRFARIRSTDRAHGTNLAGFGSGRRRRTGDRP